jgi:hypothetical protein
MLRHLPDGVCHDRSSSASGRIPHMSRTTLLVSVLILLYVGGYIAFRQSNAEVWDRDRQTYVIFPQGGASALYYLWRPLTYVDGAMTGMRFHIGPHR